jgi:5-methylcytosine-specific restriction protein A
MRAELIIIAIAVFLIYNIYHGNKYSKIILSYKKYYQIIIIAIVAISICILIRRDPLKSRQMLLYANNMIKYMPIDKSSMSIITPIFDFTNANTNKGFVDEINANIGNGYNPIMPTQQPIIPPSNKRGTKRSVSETKKKYVAYMQDWKCHNCDDKLTHTFEVDHKIRLENGGSNDVSNLVAMCRECHGQKTAMENM